MSEGASRQEQINEKKRKGSVHDPNRPTETTNIAISKLPRRDEFDIGDRSINLADDHPPPSSARGRHHHPQNGADRFQHLPINTDRFHVRNQRSRIRRRRTERHRTSHHRRRRPTGRPLHREEADQHHKDRTRESKAISKEVHTLIKGASQSL